MKSVDEVERILTDDTNQKRHDLLEIVQGLDFTKDELECILAAGLQFAPYRSEAELEFSLTRLKDEMKETEAELAAYDKAKGEQTESG